MSAGDSYKTQKIAKHRVHIERLIAKVKTFQILSNTIPTYLFHSINKIWSIAHIMPLYKNLWHNLTSLLLMIISIYICKPTYRPSLS
jgi:hypothetical protein